MVIDNKTKCPVCDVVLKARKSLPAVDSVVYGCMRCKMYYGVEGDDTLLNRSELGDEMLQAKLQERAIRLIQRAKALQERYKDAPEGQLFC